MFSKHKELLNEFIIRCDYQCLVQLRKVGAYSVSSAGATLSYSNFLGLLSFINFKWVESTLSRLFYYQIHYYIFLQWEKLAFSSSQAFPAHLLNELAFKMHFMYGTYNGRHSPLAALGIFNAYNSYYE